MAEGILLSDKGVSVHIEEHTNTDTSNEETPVNGFCILRAVFTPEQDLATALLQAQEAALITDKNQGQ